MRSSPGRLSPFPARRKLDALPWAMRALLILSAVLLVAVWGWLRSADSRALASMDPDLRGELFQRSRAEAESLCARPQLEEECQSRLAFLELFPECDSSCRTLVATHRRRPTR